MKSLTIVISGLPGAGSSTISKEIAKELKYEYFSPGEYFKKLSGSLTSKSALITWSTDIGKSIELHKKIDEMQIELAKRKGVVICGKLSLYFLKNLADFKIWLEASLETRAKRTAMRDGISFEEALEIIKERERRESEEFKRIYNIDYYSLKNFADYILNNENLTVEEAKQKILEKISTLLV
ncbi:MAG: cytidylate kinase family protein [Candidatus Aenigmarchaeota archaeon]|nr:cytidylate kinase family protein [Candidatus Aenigmarchaeota archaeon]MDW8149054.1 cytidylate kinase family protein [Candidatus Aenigmarchaeota archaeon]